MLSALLMSAVIFATPQDLGVLREVGLCYSGAVGMRTLLEADIAAGNKQEGDDQLLVDLQTVETESGLRLDAMDTAEMSEADLIALDEDIAQELESMDDQALYALMGACWLVLGLGGEEQAAS